MTLLSDAIARFTAGYYNSNPIDAVTNPGGLGNDGHEVNFPQALQDMGLVTNAYLALAGSDLLTLSAAYGLRNRLLNGNFRLWQRATSQTATGVKSADRWKVDAINNVTMARAANTAGEGKYCLQLTPSNAANSITVGQTVPDDRLVDIPGNPCAFSFKATCAAGSQQVTASIQKSATANDTTGGGGGWTTIATQAFVLGAAIPAAPYSITAAIPNDGTANGLRCVLSTANTTNGVAIAIWQAAFTKGAFVPPYEHRPVDAELKDCERFCEHNFALDVVPANALIAPRLASICWFTNNVSTPVKFRTPKFKTPTMTGFSGVALAGGGTAGRWNILLAATWTDGAGLNFTSITTECFSGDIAGNATATGGAYLVSGGWLAEAELP